MVGQHSGFWQLASTKAAADQAPPMNPLRFTRPAAAGGLAVALSWHFTAWLLVDSLPFVRLMAGSVAAGASALFVIGLGWRGVFAEQWSHVRAVRGREAPSAEPADDAPTSQADRVE